MKKSKFLITVGNLKEGENTLEFFTTPEELEVSSIPKTDAFKCLSFIEDNIKITLNILRSGDKVLISGIMSFSASLICAICSSTFLAKFNENFQCEYVPSIEKSIAKNLELTEEEASRFYYLGPQINLMSLLYDVLILAIPLAPHCPTCSSDKK